MSLRVGVVGLGFMGTLHAEVVRTCPLADLVAVVDTDVEMGRRAATQLEARHYRTVEDALAAAAADAYVVALPDRSHADVAVSLLEAGKPVLIEKPLAHSLEAAERIARAERSGGGRLLVGHLLRHDPRYTAAAEAVQAGAIGEPVHAVAGRIASRMVGTRMNGSSSVLFYLGVHDADAIQWVVGSRATAVYSRAVSKLMPALGVDSEDAILSVLDFDDGTIGQLFNGWTRTLDDPASMDGRLEVFGTEGRVEVDSRVFGVDVHRRDGKHAADTFHWPRVRGEIRGNLVTQLEHFVRAVGDERPFAVSVEEAMRAVALNDAILRSVESGRREEVEQVAPVPAPSGPGDARDRPSGGADGQQQGPTDRPTTRSGS